MTMSGDSSTLWTPNGELTVSSSPSTAPAANASPALITRADILKKIVAMVWERIPARFGLDPVRDVQV